VPELRDVTTVEDMHVRTVPDGEDERVDLVEALTNMRREMQDPTKTQVRCDAGKRTIYPGKPLAVSATYVMAKEIEDTELVTALWPADGLRLTVHDTKPDRRYVLARSIHRKQLVRHSHDSKSGTYIFEIKGFILPYQGIAVWWKSRPQRPAEPELRLGEPLGATKS
jgi:hypothetical protein